MAYEAFGPKTYHVRRYNRFNFSDEEIMARGLTKEQAETVAHRLQSSDTGLGGNAYQVSQD